MKQKTYNTIVGIIFLIVAIFHLTRIVFNWQVLFDNFVVPFWFSWVGLVVAGILAYLGLKFFKDKTIN